MLIGIDGNEANVNNRVGSNVYAYEVINGLYKLEKEKKENKYIVYLKSKPLADFPRQESWWRYKVVGPKKFWTRFGLPLALFTQKEKLDVFFTPGHYGPMFCPVPAFISVLDTSYLSFPGYFNKDDLHKLMAWTAGSVKKAKKVITISESSKKDIIKFYKRKAGDVVVAYPGYDRRRYNVRVKSQKTEIKNIRKKYNINTEYIIYVGTLQPRKNLTRLIEAFNGLGLGDVKLVITGRRGWMYDEIFDRVEKLGLTDKVLFTGYVEVCDLPYLVAGAKLFVLPSLYEGFGIPVVEAKALGVVTVISKNSSLIEVGGNSSIFIEKPEQIENIEGAIQKALNLNQAERNEIIGKGLEEIKKFDWEKCVEKIISSFLSGKETCGC